VSEASCLSELTRLSYSYHEHTHIGVIWQRCVSVSINQKRIRVTKVTNVTARPLDVHHNLKTIADICSLLCIYVEWRKISDIFACQGHSSRSRSFLEGSRSLCKVMSHSVAGSETPSLMASFCSLFVVLMT